jgi:hypothetical protein
LAVSLVIFLSTPFLIAGTVGSNWGILMAGLPVILSLEFIRHKKNRKKYYFLFIIVLVSIFLIHPQPTIFAYSMPILVFLAAHFKKDINIKETSKFVLLVITALLMSVIFLFLTNRELLIGIVNEMQRKLIQQAPSFYSSSQGLKKSFAEQSMNNIYSIVTLNILYLTFFIIGIISCLKKKKIYSLVLLGGSFLLSFFPLFPLSSRIIYYFLYPLIIVNSFGFLKLYKSFENNKRRIISLLLVLLVIVIGISKTAEASFNPQHWIASGDMYLGAFKMSNWISRNLNSSRVIACPYGGPTQHLLEALSDNKYYFSKKDCCRDVPSLMEINLIYDQETRITEKIKIIKKYKIDAIIPAKDRDVDVEELRPFYPDLEIYDINGTSIILLNKDY